VVIYLDGNHRVFRWYGMDIKRRTLGRAKVNKPVADSI